MSSLIARLAGIATAACVALAIVVGVIDSDRIAAVSGAPATGFAIFGTATPAVRSLI